MMERRYSFFTLLNQQYYAESLLMLVKMKDTVPEPPDEIPNYVVDGLRRQDEETLRLIQEYIDELIEWQQREVEPDEVADDDEEVVGVEEHERGTVVEKRVPCGKDCGGCPHGPYRYLAYREGSKVKTEYLGPAEN
jgi:hypothetical protein